MSNSEHLKLLTGGTKGWNAWRAANPRVPVDLSGARLRGVNLQGVDFFGVNLRGADATGANLSHSRLDAADLRSATLDGAVLRNSSMFAKLDGMSLVRADLQEAFLPGTALMGVHLEQANLIRANLAELLL